VRRLDAAALLAVTPQQQQQQAADGSGGSFLSRLLQSLRASLPAGGAAAAAALGDTAAADPGSVFESAVTASGQQEMQGLVGEDVQWLRQQWRQRMLAQMWEGAAEAWQQ
jgi:hypothetical protein